MSIDLKKLRDMADGSKNITIAISACNVLSILDRLEAESAALRQRVEALEDDLAWAYDVAETKMLANMSFVAASVAKDGHKITTSFNAQYECGHTFYAARRAAGLEE